jgi:hypothetical protein
MTRQFPHRRVIGTTTSSVVLLSSLVFFGTHSDASTLATPPPATLHTVNSAGNTGNWYSGATPGNGQSGYPVLVFVQGLHSDATQWFQDSMYQYAYNSGYRTAFVQLADSDGTGGSMVANGSTLVRQLQAITSYYGVNKVDIIAHSKGGNDTQAAIVYDGANRYVNQVFELSTPNYGSQLADLAYSWWAGWLASILGQRDAAVYDLQTSRMDTFRNQYDNTLANSGVDFDTTSGTNHGAWFSSLWYGGTYLSAYGPNDGVVTVASAHLPDWYSIHAWTDDPDNPSITYNHTSIQQASNTWQFIQPWLENIMSYAQAQQMPAQSQSQGQVGNPVPAQHAADQAHVKPSAPAKASGPKTWTSPAVIYRGGAFGGSEGSKVETFQIDPSTRTLTLGVLSAHSNANIVLYGPNGKVIPLSGQQQNKDGIFANAYSFDYVLDHPKPGTYRLAVSEATRDGYLMIGEMAGAPSPMVTTQTAGIQPGANVPVTVQIAGANHNPGATGRVTIAKVDVGNSTVIDSRPIEASQTAGDTWQFNLKAPLTPGVYNASISIPSIIQGAEAERSITYSFTVGSSQ